MEKKELFQIGEVSRLFHISVGILRHYDKIGLLSPEYTDPNTGYRYYSIQQFECLNTIRYLRALDLPLDRIAFFLKNREIDSIRELLLTQREEVMRRQQDLELIRRKIENRLEQLDDAVSSKLDSISLERKPPRRVASLKKRLSPKSYLDLEYSIRELEEKEDSSVTFLGKVGVGLSPQALKQRHFCPYELVFILLDDEDHFHGPTLFLPKETCVTIRFQGSHDKAPAYYERLMDHIEKNRFEISGFSKEITMIDDGLTSDPSKFVTEIQIPVLIRNQEKYEDFSTNSSF